MKIRVHTVKRMLACVMVAVMALTAVPFGGLAGLDLGLKASAEELTQGYYTYFVDEDKAVITDCDASVSGEITVPSVLGGYPVVGIGDGAFCECTELTSVTIPDSITSVGYNAFEDCIGLTGVIIGGGVTSLDWYTFGGCTALTSVTIPNSVTNIGDYVFRDCTSLTGITIPDSIESIGDGVFYDCTGLLSITLPDSIKSIGDYAFVGCTGLTGITIPNSITSIGDYAFVGCTGLTEITIPNSVTSIGDRAFKGCTILTGIEFPDSIKSIGDEAFADCSSLTDITIPDSVETIGDGAFSYCTALTGVSLGSGVTSIGDNLFYYCKNLAGITIPDSVESIGSKAFYNCTGLTGITIPDSVTNIGDGAFYDCEELASVSLGNSVTGIGGELFYNCKKITDITIPDSVESIGKEAFYGCSGLKDITIPDSVTSIGDKAFSGCTGFTSVTIPDSVTSIGNQVFIGCGNVTSINVDENNPNYSSSDGVLFNKDRTVLIQYALGKKSGSYVIPDGVTSIGKRAFFACRFLTDVTVPESVTRIDEDAFCGCTYLTDITIGSGVTGIGKNAFWNTAYYNLQSNWKNDVLYLGEYLLKANSSLSGEYKILTGTKLIADKAFEYCTDLTGITIPDSVTSIGENAFYGCENLKNIYGYNNTQAESFARDNGFTFVSLGDAHTHSYTSKVTKAATCTQEGVMTYTCSCGDSYTKAIPATGHQHTEEKAAVAATCAENGYTAGVYCNDCKTWISGHEEVAATGAHNSNKVAVTKATFSADGKIVKSCSVCGKQMSVTPVPRAVSTVLSSSRYTYSGKAITPSVTVKDRTGKVLVKGTDYNVTYAAGRTNPGRYAVTVTFINNYSGSITRYFDILPGVTGKIAATQTTNAIKLTWYKVPGATGYRVFLYNAKTKKYVTVATTTKNTVTLTKLQPGTDYIYAVKAYTKVGGKVIWSAGYKTIATATKPNTPTLKAVAGSKKATLSWTKQTGADGYVIYMATSKNGKYTKIANVKGTVSSFTKTKLTTGKTYYFKVAAYSVAGGKVIYSGWSTVRYAKIK